MAQIRPFRGLRYNQKLVDNLGDIICPPYDIISPQMQQLLYLRNDYNIIRLEHGLKLPQDTLSDNKYKRAVVTLQQWLEQGILQPDIIPAIYLHDHYFTYQDKRWRRRGIIACAIIEDEDKGVIRPHENTGAASKSDRLELLRACQANLSPIFALYRDPEHKISPLLSIVEHSEPLINFTDNDDESHLLWAISQPETISRLSACLAQQPLYLADGHHRYQTSLQYRKEMNATSNSLESDQAFQFTMMTLVELSDPGLIVLPVHRLIRGLSSTSIQDLRGNLETLFEISIIPWHISSSPSDVPHLDTVLKPDSPDQIVLGLLGLEPDHLLVLRSRSLKAIQNMMPDYYSEAHNRLCVSILRHIILEKWLQLDHQILSQNIDYTIDEMEARQRVLSGEFQLAFLLNPTSTELITAIADVGDRMPDKSTYFYPKLPTGLVIHHFPSQS